MEKNCELAWGYLGKNANVLDVSCLSKMPRPPLASCSHTRGLKDDEEELQPSYHHHVPTTPGDHVKSHSNSGDNQMKNLNDPPASSLKGLVKTKNRGASRQHEGKNRNNKKKVARQNLVLEEVSLSPEPFGLSLEFQEPLYKKTTVSTHLSDDEDDWREKFPPSSYDKTHLSRISNVAQCDPFDYNSAILSGMETFSSWPFNDNDPCIGCPSHTKVTESYTSHEEPIEEVDFVSSQLSYQELKEENSMLRRKIKRIQNFSESQTQMVRNLERTLQATMNKEEKEAQDLEALMQQAEQNLQCMTQRALKAESNTEKLKQEMSFLQAELTCYKVENESLRSGQSTNMGAVKQHVEIALQNLLRVTNHAHATIHQLVFGAETLTLVADLLKSVGRMTEVEKEEEITKQT